MPAERLRRHLHPAVHRADSAESSVGHEQTQGPRVLGASAIALIGLAALLTLRSLPSVAEYGWSSVAYYLLGAIFFFIPLALVAAELATGWPRAGGLYAWVREAFSDRSGFLAIWFEWIENVVWFPTVLSFVAAAIAYVIEPHLANEKLYLVIVMLVVFWSLTLASFFGMKWTLRLNNPAVIIGTLIPAAILIGLGIYWLAAGKHLAIPFHASKLAPNLSHVNNMVFFVGVILGYAGIEMAGFHAKETRNAAIVICSAPPFIVEKIKKPSWIEEHPDEVLLDLDEDKTPAQIASEEASGLAAAGGVVLASASVKVDEKVSAR
jgi:hypothetical protein